VSLVTVTAMHLHVLSCCCLHLGIPVKYIIYLCTIAFSALTQLIGHQEKQNFDVQIRGYLYCIDVIG